MIVELDPENHVISVADLPFFPPLFSFFFQVFFVSVLLYPIILYFQELFTLFIISKMTYRDEIKKDQRKKTDVFVHTPAFQNQDEFLYYSNGLSKKDVLSNLNLLRSKNNLNLNYLIKEVNGLLIRKELSRKELYFFLRTVLQLDELDIKKILSQLCDSFNPDSPQPPLLP